MIGETHIGQSRINSWFVLGMFWIALLFQLTALKNIWSIQTISTTANSIALLLLTVYAFKTIVFSSFSKKIWYYYIIPGVLVFFGIAINVGLNAASNSELVAYFGFLIPWAAYLSMPGLLKRNSINYKLLWRVFHFFIVVSVVLGLLDYLMYLNGWLELRVLETSYGVFLGGRFSLFHMLEDGTPHYRFYANFVEPGTLAMWLLPVIAYAFLSKKYISLSILVIGLFLTDSLGGWISFLLLIVIMFFVKLNHRTKNKYATLAATTILLVVMTTFLLSSLIASYDNRNMSATVREDNISMAIDKLPTIMVSNPMGLDLAVDTKSNMENEAYIGSNFIPVVYFQNGGILSFVGYMSIWIFVCSLSFYALLKCDLSLEEEVAFSSLIILMPFIVQRSTILESSVFAFLWAPIIIDRLSTKQRWPSLI